MRPLLAVGGIPYARTKFRTVDVSGQDDNRSLTDLTYSKQEILNASTALGGHNNDLLLGQDATETAFKRTLQQQYGTIPLAAHGIASDPNPDNAGIILLPDATADAAIADLKQRGCDHLIIDLRGNIGGGLGFARLASYLCADRRPIGYSLTPARQRRGYKLEDLERVVYPASAFGFAARLTRFAVRDKSICLLTQRLGSQPFHGNVAILVNEWTNSAAEMVAGFASENKLATIIGRKTPGNVLGAVNIKVGAGYWLRLPVFGWLTSGGACLEGNGVTPDLAVEVHPEELHVGIDQQLLAATKVPESATIQAKNHATVTA